MKCKTCLINSTCIDPCDLDINETNIEEFFESDILIQRLIKYHRYKNLLKKYSLSKSITVQVTGHEIIFFKDGKYHRGLDKPAVICWDGYKVWYNNGKFIRSTL